MKLLKQILIFFFLLFEFQPGVGQGICTIKLNTGFTGETIELLDRNNFRYYSYSCTHNVEEIGTYSFDDKELKLKFIDTIKNQLDSRIVSFESKQNNTNKVKIKFTIISDTDNQPLDFATIRVNEEDKTIAGNKTDINGEAVLTFDSSNKETVVRVTFVGFQAFELPMKFENQDYQITINLSKKKMKIHKNGEEIVYFIARETNNYIEMSNDGYEYIEYKITCR